MRNFVMMGLVLIAGVSSSWAFDLKKISVKDGKTLPSDPNARCTGGLEVSFPGGPKVFFCSEKAFDKAKKSYSLGSEVNTRVEVLKSKGMIIESLGSYGGAAANPYSISFTGKNQFVITESIDVEDKPYPFTTESFQCKNGKCQNIGMRCVLKLPKDLFPGIVAQVQKELPTLTQMKQEVLLEHYHQLAIRALSGDAEAHELLMNKPEELDGAYAEVIGSYRDWIKRAHRLKCIGRS